MAKETRSKREDAPGQGSSIQHVFLHLTPKQREALVLIAENRTSKEIAWKLGISESAVNQRIEGVRTRVGSPPRAELARAYRQYIQDTETTHVSRPDDNVLVLEAAGDMAIGSRDEFGGTFALADAVTYTVTAPWQRQTFDAVVPEVLDGENAGLSRTAAMIAIAGGILLVAMVGLGVVRALSHLI